MASSGSQENGVQKDTACPQETRADSKKETDPDMGDYSEDGSGEKPVRQKLKETSIAGTGTRNQDQGSKVLQTSTAKQELESEIPPPSATQQDSGSETPQTAPGEHENDDGGTTERGRLKKKRSLDDLMNEDGEQDHCEESGHRRKRSRDSKSDDTPEREAETEVPTSELEKMKSPKKKRSRDQFDKDLNSKPEEGTEDKDKKPEEEPSKENADTEASGASSSPSTRTSKGEPEKKRHRDSSQDRHTEKPENNDAPPKAAVPNAFSNTSTTSPFASLGSSKTSPTKKKDQPGTELETKSSSAFASSTLATFAGSDKSPFGTIGGGTSSVFKVKPNPKGDGERKAVASGPGASPFADASGPSPFASSFSGSAFGKSAFASGFAAAGSKPGERLTSFASPKPTAFGAPAHKSKAFGGKAEDDDGEEEEEDEEQGDAFQGLEEEKEDTRFYKQETETGEEDEETHFTCRGKLFHFTGSEWKERGVGTFKLNSRKDSGAEGGEEGDEEEGGSAAIRSSKKSARFIMRTDGVFRVILNIPLYKGMKVGNLEGDEPTGKQVQISGIENNKIIPLLLRTSNAEAARDLYAASQEFLSKL